MKKSWNPSHHCHLSKRIQDPVAVAVAAHQTVHIDQTSRPLKNVCTIDDADDSHHWPRSWL